ncbi:MAG: hypothetical protein R3C18_24570 [Planctomycetaceae bacterium]
MADGSADDVAKVEPGVESGSQRQVPGGGRAEDNEFFEAGGPGCFATVGGRQAREVFLRSTI